MTRGGENECLVQVKTGDKDPSFSTAPPRESQYSNNKGLGTVIVCTKSGEGEVGETTRTWVKNAHESQQLSRVMMGGFGCGFEMVVVPPEHARIWRVCSVFAMLSLRLESPAPSRSPHSQQKWNTHTHAMNASKSSARTQAVRPASGRGAIRAELQARSSQRDDDAMELDSVASTLRRVGAGQGGAGTPVY